MKNKNPEMEKTELLSNSKREIVVISDTHIGSNFALFPKEFKDWRASDLSLEILAGWEQFKKDIGTYDTVIHVGDVIEGGQKKQWGRGTNTPDINIQLEAAKELLFPLVEGKAFYQFSGSGYHGSLDTIIEQFMCDKLDQITTKSVFCGFEQTR